ncbi:MAG: hypothetical protein EZS28_016107 [Streblomastix strix]|uniref:Uncharacterized protein n=1 Tax=Streblomastix strix TaxID=222440 RepID=A0A5J4W0I9_9EUKA|nr:MAG: hypothetical protein EZS28_016107 [Streblomastix strix]
MVGLHPVIQVRVLDLLRNQDVGYQLAWLEMETFRYRIRIHRLDSFYEPMLVWLIGFHNNCYSLFQGFRSLMYAQILQSIAHSSPSGLQIHKEVNSHCIGLRINPELALGSTKEISFEQVVGLY